MDIFFILAYWAISVFFLVRASQRGRLTESAVWLVAMMFMSVLFYVQSTLNEILVILEKLPQ